MIALHAKRLCSTSYRFFILSFYSFNTNRIACCMYLSVFILSLSVCHSTVLVNKRVHKSDAERENESESDCWCVENIPQPAASVGVGGAKTNTMSDRARREPTTPRGWSRTTPKTASRSAPTEGSSGTERTRCCVPVWSSATAVDNDLPRIAQNQIAAMLPTAVSEETNRRISYC